MFYTILLFFFLSILIILLNAAGVYQFDFQLEKMSLSVLLIFSGFLGFLIGNLINYRSSKTD